MIFGSGLSSHAFLVRGDRLYGFGQNIFSQLGLGDKKKRTQLTPITFFDKKKITKVSCGSDHSVFLSNNEIYSCGRNRYGELGLNDKKKRTTPTRVRITREDKILIQEVKILDVFVGGLHTHVLSTLLEVYSFGYNGSGQLGVGDFNERISAVKTIFYKSVLYKRTEVPEKIISIATGGNYSCFLTISGGENRFGQLGINSITWWNTPKKPPKRMLFFKGKNIMQICCGLNHTFFLTSDNQVYGTGYNNSGELGIGNFINQKTPSVSNLKNEKIIRVKCGAFHSCFASKKKIWLTGYNRFGQLGNGNCGEYGINCPVLFSIEGKKIIQTLLLYDSSIYFTKNEVYGVGCNENGELFCGETGEIKPIETIAFKIQDLEVKRRKHTKCKDEILKRIEFMLKEHKKQIFIQI